MEKNDSAPIRILIAPLDWGLGHATRCIPLIRFFLRSGCEVWVASDGRIEHLLRKEFPSLNFVSLKGYNIRYAATRVGLLCKIMGQIPRILQIIRYEKRWLRKTAKLCRLDAVVSDNRFGFCHPDIPCVYLTHQLLIKAPFPSLIQRLHYHFINRFDTCWVPDLPGKPNLSGDLGHPRRLPRTPVHYLGPLSRFEKIDAPEEVFLLVLLSGPEPQRTLFERQILHQIGTIPGRVVLVRGLPGEAVFEAPDGLVVHNHLTAASLNKLLASAHWVISRTGYTTVMDLVRLQKKSILVPTPGQTEQEYLAAYLRSEGIAYTVSQKGFSLPQALEAAAAFSYRFPTYDDAFEGIAGAWLDQLRARKT